MSKNLLCIFGLTFFFLLIGSDNCKLTSQENQKKHVNMPDFFDSGMGFSFRAGKVIKDEAQGAPNPRIDLIWDPLAAGLMTSNSKLGLGFNGSGGIIDMGKKPLNEVKSAPKDGYVPILNPKQIFEGHTYCVRTTDGKHYGKIHVKKYNPFKKILDFEWEYQPNGSNEFK